MKLVITIRPKDDVYKDFKIMFFLNNGFEVLNHSMGGTIGSPLSEHVFVKEISDDSLSLMIEARNEITFSY